MSLNDHDGTLLDVTPLWENVDLGAGAPRREKAGMLTCGPCLRGFDFLSILTCTNTLKRGPVKVPAVRCPAVVPCTL